ncbi:hypothetical protein QMK38_04325 [Lysinibacillus fusiformis]|nr:hypothetical protein [Lysinibacillus fusiformis]
MKVEINLLVVLLFILGMSFYTKMEREVNEEIPSHIELSQENQKRINEIYSNREEFLNQVAQEIRNAGLASVTTGMVTQEEGVQIKVVIREGDSVTEEMHKKTQEIYEAMLIKYDLNPEIFKLEVGHAEKAE